MRIWPVEGKIATGETVELQGTDARHIRTVLRKVTGDAIRVSGENGRVFEAKITTSSKNLVIAELIKEINTFPLKKPDLTLAVSICRHPVMELIVQKAVELGCAAFHPVITERSVIDNVSPAKFARLKKIAHEACKQCGRPVEMTIAEPVKVKSLPDADLKIALWENENKKTLKSVLARTGSPESVLLLVGPPGGFSNGEIERFKKLEFKTAGVGELVLKSETAAMALLSIVDYHFGKLE